MDRPYRPLLMALGALGVFAVLFLIGGAIGWWSPAADEQAIGEISRWCERVSGGLLREPINTLGNLGFVVSGLAMFLVLARDTIDDRDQTNRFIGHQPIALMYAAATVFLGPGSMVMHGSHTFFGAWLDNVSMVAYILIPWLFNLAVLGRWKDRRFFVVYGSVLMGYATLALRAGSGHRAGPVRRLDRAVVDLRDDLPVVVPDQPLVVGSRGLPDSSGVRGYSRSHVG